MARYSFLVLCLLFLLPGILIFALRPDLRRLQSTTALLSLPFAATEFLFYPEYWEPASLFNLIETVGFGVEDLLFVAGLGALTSSLYPVVERKKVVRQTAGSSRAGLLRLVSLFAATAAAVAICALTGIAMIYAAPAIMTAAARFIGWKRHDLLLPSVIGGALTVVVYAGLSLVFLLLIPGVFELDWHTDRFLNLFVLGIPVEELIYGFSAGLIGSMFYPYVFNARFGPRRATR